MPNAARRAYVKETRALSELDSPSTLILMSEWITRSYADVCVVGVVLHPPPHHPYSTLKVNKRAPHPEYTYSIVDVITTSTLWVSPGHSLESPMKRTQKGCGSPTASGALSAGSLMSVPPNTADLEPLTHDTWQQQTMLSRVGMCVFWRDVPPPADCERIGAVFLREKRTSDAVKPSLHPSCTRQPNQHEL
jgi:hypothetical protein